MEISDKKFEKWKSKMLGDRHLYHGDMVNVDFCDETVTMKIHDKRTSINYEIKDDKARKHEEHLIFKTIRRVEKEEYINDLIYKISTKKQKEIIDKMKRMTIEAMKKDSSMEGEDEE